MTSRQTLGRTVQCQWSCFDEKITFILLGEGNITLAISAPCGLECSVRRKYLGDSVTLWLTHREECESLFSDSSGRQASLIMIHIFTLKLSFSSSTKPGSGWIKWAEFSISGSEELNKTVSRLQFCWL